MKSLKIKDILVPLSTSNEGAQNFLTLLFRERFVVCTLFLTDLSNIEIFHTFDYFFHLGPFLIVIFFTTLLGVQKGPLHIKM